MAARALRYDLLAALFEYPGERYTERLAHCVHVLEDSHQETAALLAPFLDRVRGMTVEELQEMYTRTFDINPVCTLEVGWHVYGEDYARGAFLVKMREKLRENNLPESVELPDYLTHVLILLGRLDGDEADQLAARYLLPAFKKMTDGLLEGDHAYAVVVQAAEKVVRSDHDVEMVTPRQPRGDPPGWTTPLPVLGGPAGPGKQEESS